MNEMTKLYLNRGERSANPAATFFATLALTMLLLLGFGAAFQDVHQTVTDALARIHDQRTASGDLSASLETEEPALRRGAGTMVE